MSGPRYSIIPARFFEDARLRCAHFRVMGYLGKHSHGSGWMKLSQTKAAADESVGLARGTINRAMGDLVEWGYVDKKTKTQTKRSICFYRILMDSTEEPGDDIPDVGGCDVEVTPEGCDAQVTTGCNVGGHRVVTSEVTTVVTHGVTIKEKEVPSLKFKNITFSRSEAARREDLISDLKSKGTARPAITLTPADCSWSAWLDHMKERGLSDEMAGAVEIVVSVRWPNGPNADLPVVKKRVGLTAKSRQLVGGDGDGA